MRNIWTIGCVFDRILLDERTIPLTQEAIQLINYKTKGLTVVQSEALVIAFEHRVSIIQGKKYTFFVWLLYNQPCIIPFTLGPPGTGKTHTIAAISEVATSLRRRGRLA